MCRCPLCTVWVSTRVPNSNASGVTIVCNIKITKMKVLSLLLSTSISMQFADAFSPQRTTRVVARSRSTQMEMGFFDGIAKAFSNDEVRITGKKPFE